MIWQSVIVVLLGCTLAGNTFTSAVRPLARNRLEIADGEELLRALEFLDKYESERRDDNLDNVITDDYPMMNDDYGFLPYDPLLTQDRLTGNGLPKLSPYIPEDYPLEEPYVDPYDLLYNTDTDYPVVDDLPIGERMNQNWEIRQVVNRLLEDAVMEEMLREDAAAAAELLNMVDDMEEERDDESGGDVEEEGFLNYSQEPEISNGLSDEDTGSDVDLPSFVLDDDYSNQETPVVLDSFADYGYESIEDDDGVDEGLIEAVILRLAEGQMKDKLLEEEGVEKEADLTVEAGDGTDAETDAEIDNFVAQVMSELLEGSQDLANRLVAEIEEEKGMLAEDDTLDQGEEGEDAVDDVVFSDGWDKPEQKRTLEFEPDIDLSCPALDVILDDCMVVDEFPGLGDSGYKEGFVEECNRHQLCYFCSGTFGIPYNLCDETYKMELMTTCGDDDECGFRAKYFWLSALSSRDPTPVALDVCRERCVVAYLLDNY